MRKTILATLLVTIVIASCKKDKDQSIEGLFGGNLFPNGTNDTGEVLLRIFPGNEIKISAFTQSLVTEIGNWQLEGTSFKATFSDENGSILKLEATWDAGAGSLAGMFVDGDNKPVATTKLIQNNALPVEGTYKGLLGQDSNEPSKNFEFTVKPTGVITDNNGATGTWALINDRFTASLGAIGDNDPYTLNGFYNLTTGSIRGRWLSGNTDGMFKVSK